MVITGFLKSNTYISIIFAWKDCVLFFLTNSFVSSFMEISTVVLKKNILKVDNVFPYFAIILLGKGRGPSSKQIETLSSKDILCANFNSGS